MSDFQAIPDRVEIEGLRGELTDAVATRDWDRGASLFKVDGAVRIPCINAEALGGVEICTGIARLQGLLDYFAQTTPLRTAGSSPSASTRSDTSTPHRWQARRHSVAKTAQGENAQLARS